MHLQDDGAMYMYDCAADEYIGQIWIKSINMNLE